MEQLNLFEEPEPVAEHVEQPASGVPRLNTTCPYARYLQSLFRYEDGVLYWKINHKCWNGKKAGSVSSLDGYRRVCVNQKSRLAHRVIWQMFYGKFSDFQKSLLVDHINRNRDDNRIENLRLVSKPENAKNIDWTKCRKIGEHGLGIKKIGWGIRRWYASITSERKRFSSTFHTKEEAILWRDYMTKKLHGKFAGTNS